MLMLCRPLMSPISQQRRQANECREGLSDDICGNARKVRAQSTLILEAFSKRACCKDRAEFRHYAAANVDTAACAEGQSEIASNCSQHGTKHIDGLAAVRFTLADTEIGDLCGRVGGSRDTVDLSKRVVEVDEARSGEDPFRRYMVEMDAHTIEYRAFPSSHRCHRHMPAFPAKGKPFARHRNEPTDPEA